MSKDQPMKFDWEGNCLNIQEISDWIKQPMILPKRPEFTSNDSFDVARKLDYNKSKWHLMPWDALEEVQQVLDFGAEKYGDRNWEKGFNYQRLFSASMRHLLAWIKGQDKDPETGFGHLSHAVANLLFLLAHQSRKIGVDDRGK